MEKFYKLLFLSIILGLSTTWSYGQITYVNHAAGGANDGTSWLNAYTNLNTAITNTASGEIWVAQGTYKPTTGTDRTISFTLKNNVVIYGGFNGTEVSLSQRDYEDNETIMSGDIGVASDTSDNSYHVIYVNGSVSSINSSAVLDGVTVSGGNAGEGTLPNNQGGGIFLYDNASPTIRNCKVKSNRALVAGGGMSVNSMCDPVIENTIFESNVAYEGGGIYAFTSAMTTSTINIKSCIFKENKGGFSSAFHCSGIDVTITNSLFYENRAGDLLYEDGGTIYAENDNTLSVYNSTIADNRVLLKPLSYSASQTAGIKVASIGTTAEIRNTIFYLNQISDFVQQGYRAFVQPPTATGTVDYCIGKDLPSSPNNTNVNPLFVGAGDYRLQSTSSAINAGDNSEIPVGITTDLDNNDRIYGGTVEIGAYEFGACNYVTNNRIYVDANKMSGTYDGLTWDNAFQDLQDALAFAQSCEAVQEIWVADGTYYPTSGTDRAIAFELKNNLKIYGGFAGNETSLSQRDFQTNISILDGDIGTSADNTDNSYHVVTSTGNDNTAILDGFTIKNGNADLSSGDYNKGAGLYGDGTSMTIQNCTFTANSASHGAGVYQKNTGNSTFTNCIFHTNTTVGFSGGGGAYIRDATSSFTNCLFYENHAYFGGGIYNLNTQITVTNSTFADNTGFHGGGIYSYDTDIQRYTVANCIFWNPSTSSEINRTGFNVTYSIINGGYTGTGNLNQDPLFVDAANDDYALQASSPAVDAGSNAAVPVDITTDLAGFDRIINGTVNMGAFETSNSVLPVELLYFKGEVVENGNLLTWETATEINNEGFEVQRSEDGRNWFNLGFVQGNGTTLENHVYTFIDENPINGTNYYRLKQVDLPATQQAGFNGDFEYSNVIILTSQFIGNQQFTLFPNPVRSELNIANVSQGNILIYNSIGQVVRQFSVTDTQMRIEVSDLENGIYTLKFQKTDGTVVSKQFIKL